MLSISDVPYRTPIAKAFVNAGLKIGLPVIDVNGENQVGVNYIQVIILHFVLTIFMNYKRGLGLLAFMYSSVMVVEYSKLDINLFQELMNLNTNIYFACFCIFGRFNRPKSVFNELWQFIVIFSIVT